MKKKVLKLKVKTMKRSRSILLGAMLVSGMFASAQSTQCNGLTKDSVQCKKVTVSESLLCYLHNPNYQKIDKVESVTCNGTTKKGKSCKNKTRNSSGLCHNHRKN